jgi:hypothetical protein
MKHITKKTTTKESGTWLTIIAILQRIQFMSDIEAAEAQVEKDGVAELYVNKSDMM